MRTFAKLQLLALAGLMVIAYPASSATDKNDAPEKATEAKNAKPAKEKKKKDTSPKASTVAKYCPKEITKAQIIDLSTNTKLMIADREFQVAPKFNMQAGKRYITLNKDGKAPDTVAFKNEKLKDGKAICLYVYKYNAPSKKEKGKEAERKGRIRIHTMITDGKPAAETAPAEKK